MSYILGAIKKAEKQRQIEQVHTLESSVAFQPSTKRQFSWGIGIVVLLIILSMIGGWFYQQPITAWLKQSKTTISAAIFSENSKGNGNSNDAIQNNTATLPTESGEMIEDQLPSSAQLEADLSPDLEPQVVPEVEEAPEVEEVNSQPQISPGDLAIVSNIRFSVISYSRDNDKRFVMDGSNIFREGDVVMGFPIITIKKSSVIVDVKGSPYEIKL